MKEIFKTDIIGYGYDGEGVGRLGNKVAFLPFALEGESVGFWTTEEKSKFVRGKVVSIGNSNINRRDAPCPYYQKCGGCTLQHANYEHQLEIKRQLLAHQMKKVGYLGDIEVICSSKEYGYRNKIRIFVGEKGLALKERASNKHVYIKKCLLVCDRINEAIDKISNFIKLQKLQKAYSEVVIRNEEDKLLVNFVVKNPENINYQGLYLLLGNCGIFETHKHECVHKIGLQKLEVEEMGLSCEFSMTSFHQVNKYLTETLYQCVIKNVKGDNVVNCYSGAGVLSGVIAKQNKMVFGIELGESEHKDAEKLKEANRLDNLTNICGDCAEILAIFNKKVETIIIDPPRAGVAESVCEAIDKTDCQRLIYVSCNSATLVRDISRLSSFKIEKVYLFDMFAQTGEYEVLCVLNKMSDIY